MKLYYKHLADLGFSEAFVKNEVLPEWWEDEIADNLAGYCELVSITCRKLKLNDARGFYSINPEWCKW